MRRDVADPTRLARLEHRHNVRMIERRGGLRLAQKPLVQLAGGERLQMGDLEGHEPIQPWIVRQEDNSESSLTKNPQQVEPADPLDRTRFVSFSAAGKNTFEKGQ